jgi:hypothetical protein
MTANGETGAEMSPDVGELAKALSAAQGEITAASKDKRNPHFNSKYADLASVWEACRGPLTKHGLSVVQLPLTAGDMVGVSTTLMHASGQWIRGSLWGKPERPGPQALVSCVTYFRRTALAAVAGVAPDDDDGNAAEGRGAEGKAYGPQAEAAGESAKSADGKMEPTTKTAPNTRSNDSGAASIKHDGNYITDAQLKKLHATRREAGGQWFTDGGKDEDHANSLWRTKVLQVYRDTDGTRIISSKQLSRAQASHLIDRMTKHIERLSRGRVSQPVDVGAIVPDILPAKVREAKISDADLREHILAPWGADTLADLADDDKPKVAGLLIAWAEGPGAYETEMERLGFRRSTFDDAPSEA